MGPEFGALPPLKGSDVWALHLYRVQKGYVRDPHFILMAPCNYHTSVARTGKKNMSISGGS